jgi:hypothetical protein
MAGIYVGSWCCLIAVSGDYVLGWQWCDTEKKAALAALLGRFPAPRVAITEAVPGSRRRYLTAGPIPPCSDAWSMSSATCART